jgi:PAS domain S-box-containing protein
MMPEWYPLYVWPLLVTAAILAALALFAWRRRPTPGAGAFALLMVAASEWALGYALELGSTTLLAKVFWADVQYLGIVVVPGAWLVFVLRYVGAEEWLSRRNLALLAIEPVVMLALVRTSAAHGLVRSSVRLDSSGPFPALDYSYGVVFWINAAYSYVLLLVGILLLLHVSLRPPHLYRRQVIVLLIGLLAPWVGNVLYISGLRPFSYLDPSPFAFILTGLAVVGGLFRFRLLDLVPIARSAIIESMDEGVLVLDAQDRVVDLNPAAAEVIGQPISEIIGRPADQILSAWPGMVERYHDVAETRTQITLEVGDAQRTYDLRISPLYDRRGRLVGRLFVSLDVTKRKQAEKSLREEKEIFFSILQKAPYGVLLIDQDERCLYVNPEFTKITGCTLDEIPTVGDWFQRAFPDPASRKEVIERWKSDTVQRISRVFSVVCEDDQVREVEFRPTLLDGGRAILVLSDVTERKRAEEALRESEQRLRQMAENSRDAFWLRDIESLDMIYVTPAFERLWGRPIEDAYEQPTSWLSDVHPEDRDRIATTFERQVQGEPTEDEYRIVWPDGSIHWIRDRVFPILDEAGDAYRTFGIVEDISERKRAERLLEALNQAALAMEKALTPEEIFTAVAKELEKLGFSCTVFLTDKDQTQLIPRHYNYEAQVVKAAERLTGLKAEEFSIPIEAVDVYRQGVWQRQTVFVENVEDVVRQVLPGPAERFTGQIAEILEIPKSINAPLVVEDRVIALLSVQADDLSEADVSAITAFAHQIAASWRKAQLFEQAQQEIAERRQAETALRQRTRELELLNRANRALNSTLDLDLVLATVLEEMRRLLDVTASSIWLADPGTDEVICRQAAGLHSETVRGWRLAPGEGIAGWVARHGESLIVPDVQADERYFPGVDQRIGLSLHSLLSVPLLVRQSVIGALQVMDSEVGRFSTEDLALLEPLAASAAVAIENARLYAALRDHAEQLEQRVQERTVEVQAQYARLDAILRSTTDGIVVLDKTGNITQANPVAQTWLNRTLSAEDVGRLRETMWDVAQQASAETVPEGMPKAMVELTGLDLELSAAPVMEAGTAQPGEPAVVLAIHDVTHLAALDRMKSRFVANVSHELRTPVTTIKLYAHLMRQYPERWREYLLPLAHEADHQARLVEEILQISRMEAGRLEIVAAPTSLDELTRGIVAGHQVLAQEKGLTLEYHLSTDGERGAGPVALIDPERMMQAMNNLVGNAIRYTLLGGAVTISTGEQEAGDRRWATMTVTDTGIGIPEDELPYIFERFFRGEEPREMQPAGTGLGLSIAREIVELHGGHVTVESEKGVGSVFTIWLPLTD